MSEAALSPSQETRVLVVEDEPDVCELLADMLRSEGFEPYCANNDRDAYETLRQRAHFACMVVDVNLGAGTTGYDVARFARDIDPGLAVIYVSGQTSPTSFATHGVPGSLFLPKPFDGADLLERLRMLIGDNDD